MKHKRIEEGIADWRATGSMLVVPYWLALKAEVLHLADRTSEALEAITEAEALVVRTEERWWCAELHRAPRCVSHDHGCRRDSNRGFVLRSTRNREGTKVGVATETRRSNLCGIPPTKGERVRRTRISTTSLVTARSALSLGLVVGSPALSNKRLRCKARTFRLQRSAKGGVLSQGCLGELVIEGPRQIEGTR
jgi:hypothetical protein